MGEPATRSSSSVDIRSEICRNDQDSQSSIVADILARIRFRRGTNASPWRQSRRAEACRQGRTSSSTKHIDIRFRFLRDGNGSLEYISMDDVADALTKALFRQRFERLRSLMGLICSRLSFFVFTIKARIGSFKTLEQYRGDLSAVFMTPNEDIIGYISRVKDLRDSVIDASRREKERLESTYLTDIDDLTARSFISSLPFEYKLKMENLAKPHYREVFVTAKKLSRNFKRDRQRARFGPLSLTKHRDTGSRRQDRSRVIIRGYRVTHGTATTLSSRAPAGTGRRATVQLREPKLREQFGRKIKILRKPRLYDYRKRQREVTRIAKPRNEPATAGQRDQPAGDSHEKRPMR